jgi:hypothetical protein
MPPDKAFSMAIRAASFATERFAFVCAALYQQV